MVNEGGGPKPQAHLTLVLEGYSAPVTAGNFAINVLDNLYIGKTLTVDYTGVLVGKNSQSGREAELCWIATCNTLHNTSLLGMNPAACALAT